MDMKRRWILALVLLVHALTAAAVEKLPVEAFASLPALQDLQLSPDGKRFAALLNIGAHSVLITRDVAGATANAVAKTDNKRVAVNWFRWLNNDRIAVSLRYADRRYGVATMETRLMSYRYDGSDTVNLVKYDPHRDRLVPQFQDRVVDWLPEDPGHILIAADFDEVASLGVYKVDVDTGGRQRVQNFHSHVVDWITDRQHRVRVGLKFHDTQYDVIGRNADQDNWQTLWSFGSFSAQAVWPIGFGMNPDILYVKAYQDGRLAIFTVDLRDSAHKLVLKYADPSYDVGGELVYSQKTGDYIGVADTHGKGSYKFWQPQYQALAAGIDAALPGTHNDIVGFSADESRYLVFASGNKRPGNYYFGDRKTHVLSDMGSTYPALRPELLAGKAALHYKTRDGLEIQAYLTLPRDAKPQHLPTIIFPHGGPIARDDTDFDYWAEFFANRGYAVLQMDFRGSAGYGHDFMAAGLKQWGLRMQDDITDGVQALIASGVADPHRIGIVGASYGGYAALMGAVKTPDLYKCAVSFAGVSDLLELWRNNQKYTIRNVVGEQIGDYRDRAQLEETSPRRHADRIKIPILLVHGTKDRSVPFKHSEMMADALKDAGKRYTFIELKDGDHFLSNYDLRLQLFQAMDQFLAQNL
jgi:dipeptidyl aminopeptidase/acylaminoacyl peptidase